MADFFKGLSSGQKYEIKRKLGEGGQGTVALVENKKNGKMYAAKWYKSTTSSEQRQLPCKIVSLLCANVNKNLLRPSTKFIWTGRLTSPHVQLIHFVHKITGMQTTNIVP